MPDAAGIFISYRRQEASYLAGWLHDRLADHFGESRVFLDIDSIKPGVDFMRIIAEAIAQSSILLLLIGPQWLAANGSGHRRLNDPTDPVRLEIGTALQQNVRIIPLLLDNTRMPPAEDLPGDVAGVARLNALRVSYDSFRTDVGRLVTIIDQELGIVSAPVVNTSKTMVGLNEPPSLRRGTDRPAAADPQRDKDQRARLLSKLMRTYDEYLTQSVEHDSVLQLDLDLDWSTAKTFRPQDQFLGISEKATERLPAGTSMVDAFDKTGALDGDGLLVLGEPGAGKTTLLFELAQRLARRARSDPRHPIPVYLPLSSWATRRSQLDNWLVDQLAELYQIPRPLGRRWTNDAQLLFVLDGLDEIADRNARSACVKAINQFNRFGRSYRLPMVLASRPTEYDTLPVKLQLEAAVEVRPLDPRVVLEHLRQAGPRMGAAVAALQRDPQLLELLRSPLLISMLTLTYTGVTQEAIHATSGTAAERRHQLITDYVNRRFELDRLTADSKRKQVTAYPPDRTRIWLTSLASNLARNQQTVFLLGRLPLDWLPTRWARWVTLSTVGLISGSSITSVFVLYSSTYYGIALLFSISLGLLGVGLGVGLGANFISQPQPTERLSWSWNRARLRARASVINGLVYAVIIGLINGLFVSLMAGLIIGAISLLIVGLVVGIAGGLSGLSPGLSVGLGVGLTVGLGVSLVTALVDGLEEGLQSGAIDGLIFGLQNVGAYGLPSGLISGLSAGLVGQPQPTEQLSWSWTRARSNWRITLFVAGIVALGYGGPLGLLEGFIEGMGGALLFGSVVGLTTGFVSGLNKKMEAIYATPNEGIRRSARNGLKVTVVVGSAVGLIVGLVMGLGAGWDYGIAFGLIIGLLCGLPAGLAYGLGAIAQHGLLRVLIWRYGIGPLRYPRWLNHAVHLRLLYRSASGGYVFIHRMVQDHFCEAVDTLSAPGES